jgi:precorrin-6B methylase 2
LPNLASDVTFPPAIDPNTMAGRNTHALVLDWFRGRTGTVADVGAGEGALSLELARLGLHVLACDRDEKRFRARGVPRVQFTVADLDIRVPLAD